MTVQVRLPFVTSVFEVKSLYHHQVLFHIVKRLTTPTWLSLSEVVVGPNDKGMAFFFFLGSQYSWISIMSHRHDPHNLVIALLKVEFHISNCDTQRP